ncbi:hypothetical protein LguiB_022116 [Lonicera macranthoides]
MSDSFMYELDDIVWDEFGQGDDHIVPHPSGEHDNGHAFNGDSFKKPRHEVIDVKSNASDHCAAKFVSQEKEPGDFRTINKRRNTMLEKDQWSDIPENMLSASCDGDPMEEVASLASDNNRIPSYCFKSSNANSTDSKLCAGDPILSDRGTAVDNNSYSFSLSQISQTNNDTRLFNNDCEDKESNDLIYYSWPDIGNFEDVDKMFRSCDSSFQLGVAGDQDDLGWFSSSEAIEGSEDAVKSDFKFSCPESDALKGISENPEPSKLYSERFPINDSRMKSAVASYKASCQPLYVDEPATVGHSFLVNGSDRTSEGKDNSINNEKIYMYNKQPNHQNQTEREIEDPCLEDGSFDSRGLRLKNENLRPNSSDYIQTNIPYMHSDYSLPLDQTTVSPTLSGFTSENSGPTSLSPKGYSHDPLFEATTIKLDDKRKKQHARQGFQHSFTSNPKHVDSVLQSSICDPVSVQKEIQHCGNKFQNRSDVGVGVGSQAELCSPNAQESSSMNSRPDEISLEATSFSHLQEVMEQLDLRTKLCIRDSLFRLARSAEQRHNNVNLNGTSDSSGAFIAAGTNKCTGFMDMETDTNPIDRSIAHLLFHRPLDSSTVPTLNVSPLKSHLHSSVHGSMTSMPVMGQKLDCHEESAIETDKKAADQ